MGNRLLNDILIRAEEKLYAWIPMYPDPRDAGVVSNWPSCECGVINPGDPA